MAAYEICKDLAIIIVFAKVFGLLARKLKAPQVVGEIIAGLILIGTFIFKGSIFNVMILIIEFTIGWILSGIRLRRRGAFDFK